MKRVSRRELRMRLGSRVQRRKSTKARYRKGGRRVTPLTRPRELLRQRIEQQEKELK